MKLIPLIEGATIEAPEEDYRTAARVEQYRVGTRAFYVPSGLRWKYLPFSAILGAEESHHSVTAGKCVAVTERRPALRLLTREGTLQFPLEKGESLRKLLDAIRI